MGGGSSVHGRLPCHRPPRLQAHQRQRHHLHRAVSGDVERANAADGARGVDGAGADRGRPDGAHLGGVRRARRHGLWCCGGPRVDAPRPPRLPHLPPQRGNRHREDGTHRGRLGHLLLGDSISAGGGAVAAVPAPAVTHAERRLHVGQNHLRNHRGR
uniref:Uncharacterized protein n=1 Tax=Oryza rufipogon TaxID=4529 RepID=A0A0E0NKG8_ORYRU